MIEPLGPPTSRLHLPDHRLAHRAGDRSARAAGEGLEADSLRPFHDGDPARAIDWRATARMGVPWVRTRHDDRDLPLRIGVDLAGTRDPTTRLRLLQVARWLAESADASAIPVGLALRTPSGVETVSPRRGRRALRDLLARLDVARRDPRRRGWRSLLPRHPTVAPPIEEWLHALKGPGTAIALGPWDFGPGEVPALEGAFDELRRRAAVVPVLVARAPKSLPNVGVVDVDTLDGTRVVVDAADPAVAERWSAAHDRWRDALESAARGCAPLLEVPVDGDALDVLRRSFESGSSGRSRGRARRSRPGRTLRRIAGLALFSLGGGALPAHAQPSSAPEVIEDFMHSTIELGTPLQRTLHVRWTEGPAAIDTTWLRSERVDSRVLAVEAARTPEGASSGVWRIHLEYLFWETGETVLPPIRIEGARDGSAIDARPRRVRVLAAPLPAGVEPGRPTFPQLPRGAPVGGLLALPLLLAALGGGLLLLGGLTRIGVAAEGAANATGELPAPRPTSPLDEVVHEVRTRLAEAAGAHPGWSLARWENAPEPPLDPEARRLLSTLARIADARRFRADSPSEAEVVEARALAARLLDRLPSPSSEVEEAA